MTTFWPEEPTFLKFVFSSAALVFSLIWTFLPCNSPPPLKSLGYASVKVWNLIKSQGLFFLLQATDLGQQEGSQRVPRGRNNEKKQIHLLNSKKRQFAFAFAFIEFTKQNFQAGPLLPKFQNWLLGPEKFLGLSRNGFLALIVDGTIHCANHYPLDNSVGFTYSTHPKESD